jgi:ribosomal protein S20
MPIIGSAIKKLRQDNKRQNQNLLVKKVVKEAIKDYKSKPSPSKFTLLDGLLSRGVKKNIFHANKAARLKSRLSRLLTKKVKKKPKENLQIKEKSQIKRL